MLLLAGRDIGLDRVSRLAGSRQILQVLLRAISTVGQEAGGSLSALLLDHLHHWFDLLFIVGRRRHALPHDQLQPRLHCRLRVVALHQTIAALHQAAFRPSPPAAAPAPPAPVALRESSSAGSRAAAAPQVTRRPADRPRNARLRRRPPPRPGPAVPGPRPAVAAPAPSSGHSSSPCACWHWLSPWCRPRPPAPVSALPLPARSSAPLQTARPA